MTGNSNTERYLQPILGGKITNVGITDPFDGDSFPYIEVVNEGVKYTLQVSKDREGNDPGYILGLPEIEPNLQKEGEEE